MVKSSPESSGIQGFVSLGLGPIIGASAPILFLATVGIGMSTAAIIAGKYLCQLFEAPDIIAWITAIVIIYGGIASNLFGVKMRSLILSLITALLFIIGLHLILVNLKPAIEVLPTLATTFDPPLILSGMAMAMWAFAGFENCFFRGRLASALPYFDIF